MQMPFGTKFGLELFNDCLYYRSVAQQLLEKNRDDNIFEIRRALRSAFTALGMHWEYWLNTELDKHIYDKAMSMKGVSRIDENDVNFSVGLDRLLRLGVNTKIDLLVLLTGIDIRNQRKIMQGIKAMKNERNKVLHPKVFGDLDTVEKSMAKLNEAIQATKAFFEYYGKLEGTKVYDYLTFDEPVDMKSMGFGVIRRPEPRS